MAWCLIKSEAEKFRKMLKSGEINPQKMLDMTSAERRAFFAERFGEMNAKEINATFEQKLLLKNWQQGVITWAKKIGKVNPQAEKDLVAKVLKMDKLLNPAEERAFLSDYAAKKFGGEITLEEAKKTSELSKAAGDAKAIAAKNNWKDFKSNVEYGKAYAALRDYVDKISPSSNNPIINTLGVIRAGKVIGDLGMPFRQGWGMLSRKEWYSAFSQMHRYLVSKNAYEEFRAIVYSSEIYRNGALKKSGLRMGEITSKELSQREADFMSDLIQHVPGLRNIERANTGFVHYLRFSVFQSLYDTARMAGENVEDKEVLRALAKVVNDFTGSGNLGSNDKYANLAPVMNNIFFSIRKRLASLYMFSEPFNYKLYRASPTAYKAGVRQLLGSLMLSSILLGIASLLGAKAEKDFRSSNIGEFVVGKVHQDLAGGNATVATLIARLISNQSKSGNKLTNLGVGFKGRTRSDLFWEWNRNGLAPAAAVFADWMTHKSGKKDLLRGPFTVKNELKNTLLPMTLEAAIDLSRGTDNEALMIASWLLDFYGSSSNVY